MVRETRYLWIGNLPHTIREDRILEHFKRYGKVQSVKILPKKEEETGASATVAFIDIKSASKAHNADNKIDDRTLKTDYYEPPASSTASSAIYIHERDDALVRPAPTSYTAGRTPRYGLSEERNYERPGHYYADREPYIRRSIGIGYHDEDNYQGRAKSRDRYSRSAPGNNYTEGAERNQNHFRPHNARQHFDQQRYPVGDQYSEEREPAASSTRLNRRTNNTPVTPTVASVASPTTLRTENRPRRTKRRSPSRTPSGSRSNSGSRSRSRSSSDSRSSSSSSKLRSSSSDSSGRSRSPSKSRSPVSALYSSQNNTKGSRLDRPSSAIANPSSTTCYLPSAVNASAINCTSNNTQSSTPSQGCTLAVVENHCDREEKRPLGICVRNLPVRSTDTSLKDGLFHEYKKHGKVTMVKVIGQGTDRYAVVCFKKPEDVDKALEVSKDKLFFGCKIEVTAHEGLDAEDNEFRPLEAELDEFHPKATRTLFIGNLEKDITTPELRNHFEQFGEIIEIDIKKQGSATSYAFIQYSDIASVVKAMRKLDGENLGANRIKLGFGKSMPTNCVWLDGIVDTVSDKFLSRHFSRFGIVAYTAVDREKGHALVFYENVEFAQIAVSEMRGRILQGKKLQVDFASRECQTTFFDKLEMTGQMVPGDGTRPWERRERRGPEFEVVRSDEREPRVGFENRVYPRYEAQSRPPRGNFRGGQRAGFSSRGRGQGFSARYETYHDEFGERRHRYNSREDSVPEVTLFDGKTERPKYPETPECPNRKRNKLRNSISDQESHHSQSPPRSSHQSRSTSPVSSKDSRKSTKERLHHRVKSPGSQNSSLVNSPCRDVSDEMETDYRECRSKGDEILVDVPYASPTNISPRSVDKDNNKALLKGETDSLRSSLDVDSGEESASDQLGRKKRFLVCSALPKGGGKESPPAPAKSSVSEKAKGKLPNSQAVNSLKTGKVNCVSSSEEPVEESKCDTIIDNNSAPQQQDCTKPKTESANTTDLRYLQKKQVQLLHMLEQLGENANSSDVEALLEVERLKKHRSPSTCSETNSLLESDSFKSLTKDECGIKLCKSSGPKDPAILTKLKSKSDTIDSNNCISLSLDSYIFQKHLDPRKGCDQHSVSVASVNSLQKCRRISVDNETCLPIIQGASDSFLCAPSPISDASWKKECNSVNDVHFPESGSPISSHGKVKEETISDEETPLSKKSFSLDFPNRILSLRTLPDVRHEVKREISPLSLPLPKFAASLRSPKSSPNVVTSPKSISAHSPRAGHSPSSYASSKSARISDLLPEKVKDSPDDKVNGASVSPVDSVSPFEPQPMETDEPPSCMESIQSPKSNCEKVKESHSSSESEMSPSASPNRPSIEDRIKALDEKFNAWSGSTRSAVVTPDAVAPVSTVPEVPKCPVKRSRFNYLAPEIRSEPSEIVKSILARSTIFDQDTKRLQHIDEKYEPVNVTTKMDSPPKAKPTFRTKAAAKEFSIPIAPAPQPFNQSSLVKTPSTILVAQSIMSPPSTPQSAPGSVLAPITPPVHSQPTPQAFAPCSPCVATPYGLVSSTIKNSEGLSIVEKDFGDHVVKTAVFNSVKIKSEPGFHMNSSTLATSLKSPLHCPVEIAPHTMVVSSPPNIKREPASPTDSVTESVCKFEIECKVPIKKEVAVHNITSIPLKKDGCVSLTKDHLHLNSYDNDKKEFCDSKDPRLSFHESSSHWRENGCKEDVKPTFDSCAKSFTNNSEVPVNSLGPATKKRVSSIDSTESESSKSVKSLESSRESHEINWSKHDKVSEPEPKKPKLCKSVTQDRSSSPPLQAAHSKKSEKKEKSSKPEKSKTSTSKSSSSSSSTDKSKSSKSEYKEKTKSEHKSKDEKRSKSRDSKESSSKDQRTKSRERRNSEKEGKGSNPSKSKKETHGTKSESKHDTKGEGKCDEKDAKHESKGDNRHESKGDRHEGKGDGRHESKGDRHESKGESRHESKGDRHESKSDRHDSKGDSRHESKADRHDSKGDSRHESKGDRYEGKGESRHENKGDSRHESKNERHDRSESRHDSKSERHEGKQDSKEGKHDSKSDSKHDRSESKKDRHESRHEKYDNKHDSKYERSHKGRSESKHESKYECKSESKNNSDNEKSEDTKSDKKSDKKSKKSSSSSLPFDFQAFMDDAPVYFSMYDKVKARSSKSQTLKHQTSDLESVRQKFSKLKQSRAKREKTKSIEDSDKDSDSGSHHSSESDSQAKSTKLKQPRKRKLVIESSSDDGAVSHDSSSRISKMEKDFNDSATDSDFEYNVSRRQSSSLKVRKKKTDILNSDTSDSDSNFASKSQPSNSKKKSMANRSKQRPEKSRKIIRSDYEMSDVEVQQHKSKEKETKPKKVKRDKTVEMKQESESMDCDPPPKKTASEDSKAYKKKSFKDIKQEHELPSQKKVKSEHSSKEKQSSKEKKAVESVMEKMQVDDPDKHGRSYSKKRKKSKKMSKNKEKRSSSDKGDTSRKHDDSDARLSLPVLSPKPSNPLPEKQQSPPYLQAGVFSDNDYKSDFSDFDFEPNQNDTERNSDIWKQMDAKSDTNSEKSSKSKKKDSLSKTQCSIIQSPEQDSSLPSFFDKLSDVTDSETGREPADCANDVLSDCQKHHDFPVKKDKESAVTASPHKSKHEKSEEHSSRQDSNRHSDSHLSSKEERRKKKSKKQSKEKKKKREDKENPTPTAAKDSTTISSSAVMPPSPKPLFEAIPVDDDSRLSDLQIGEAIVDESSHFEQEFVVVTPETSTFDEEEPARREEKHVERRFEEEAAKETRRLEAELFSTGRDSWHMKEKDDYPETDPGELCEEKQPVDIDVLTSKEESIFTGLDLHSSITEPSQSEGELFMSGQSESDPFQMDDKDVNEIEDQRKIEDDLAVSALLQEMQCCEIPAPELTKETDYLDPLIETHPEDTMNYLLPDDGENSLHIAEGSPEGPVIDSQEEKLESSVMLLSPASNSEPPALEISTVEDSAVLKAESGNQPLTVAVDPMKKEKQPCDSSEVKLSCYDFHEDSLEMCESKPPVIDIPVMSENLETTNRTSISPKADPMKVHKQPKEIREKPLTSTVKADSNEDTDNESGSELAENQLTHFEDITMDTTDSKDDDNPPILIPVDSPRSRLPVPNKMEPPAMVIPAEEKLTICDDAPVNSPEPERPMSRVNEFDKLSIDLDEKFDQLVNHLEQNKSESKPSNQISDEPCSTTLHISDLSDQNSTDSLLMNSAGLFSNADETHVIKPFIKFQESTSLNITSEIEKESNIKYNLPEPVNPTIDPPMLHYSNILSSSSEKAVKSPKIDHDALSLTGKNIHNLEPFVSEGADTSAITDTNQASSDSFLLDLFGPKSVENEKLDTDLFSEKLKNENDLMDNADSKNKIEDSDVSSADNHSSQADTFAISEVNEQNEATEFNQEIFERASDVKDSKVPQMLSFSSEQLFTDLTNKSTEENSQNETHMDLSYDDVMLKADDSDKSDDDKLVIEESKTVDSDKLFETEAKMDEKSNDMSTDEHLSLEDSLDIKPRPADAESVCSDTTDITIPETKGESEANLIATHEEPMPEEPVVEDVEVSAKPKLERPRRGRRPKTRKYAEAASQKSEIVPEPVTTVASTRSSSRRARPTSSERPRRSLRSDNVDTVVLREYGKKRHSVDDSIHSETEEAKRDISGEVSDGLVSDATAEGDSIAPLDQKSTEKHALKSEEPRRRRGRRKKVTNDSVPVPIEKSEPKPEESESSKEYHRPKESLSWFSLMSSEKEHKPSKENNPSSAYDVFEFTEEEESENLPFESVKERLHDTVRSSSTVESKHVKVLDPKHDKTDMKHDKTELKHERSDSKHDLRVSDQKHDQIPEQKAKERPHEPIRSVISTSESKHVKVVDKAASDAKHDRVSDQKHDKVSETTHEKEKKADENAKTIEDRDIPVKEPETKEHKKISIIIRLNHNHDRSSPGTATAEVVQKSEAPNIEEPKVEPTKIEKASVKSDNSGTEASHTGPSKSTRKSTRLMNQAPKSTLDEVIEDVVKGHLKDSSDSTPAETTPTRGVMTRRSRSNRKSEENLSRDTSFDNLDESGDDKNKNEPVFFIQDDTSSRDVPSKDKKKHNLDSLSINSSTPESDKNPPKSTLRAFRITRSIASKLESSRDLADSIVTSDHESKKKDSSAVSSSIEKSESKSLKEPKEPKNVSENTVKPPLPVLKVEINRVEAKKIRVEIPKVEPPQPEKLPDNEDSNSTSSTGYQLDPATGIFTSGEKSDNIPSEATNPENKNTSPDLPTSIINIKSVSQVPPTETVTAAATSVIQEGSSFSGKSETRPPWTQSLRSRRNSNPLPPVTADTTPVVEVPPSKLPSNSEPPIKLPIRKAPVSATSVLAIADSLASSAAAAAAAAAAAMNTEPSPVISEQVSRGQSPVITARALPPISSPAPPTVLVHDKKGDVLQQSKRTPPPVPAHGYDSNSRTPPISMGHMAPIPSGAPSKSSTTAAVTCITSTKSELPIAHPSIIPPIGKHHPSSASSCKPLSLTTNPDHSSISIKQEVASSPSPSLHDSTWSGSKAADPHVHVSTIQSNTTSSSAHSVKSEGRSAQPAHCGGKSNSAFTQQPGYMPNYDDKIPGAHGLSAAAGGVIAELLQQPKEYFAASQLQQERNYVQMVRSSTPNIPSEIVSRTPPPPTSTPDIHSLHIRHPSNPPGLVVLPHNVPHPEMYMHQQMIYAALHGQHQARAAAMGRFRYPSLPPSPIVPNNSFKQPGEHLQVMMDPTKADLSDPTKMMSETTKDRSVEEKSSRSRSMRSKKEKMIQQHAEDAVEAGRQLMAAHEKMPTNPAAMGMRQLQPAHFSSQILQMSPHLTVSGLERITDSPGVANLCTAGSSRVQPHLPVQVDEHKPEGGLGSHSSHITEKPRKAHQSQPSTNLYMDAHSRQQLLSVPQIATGLIDGRSQGAAHSPSARSQALAASMHNAPGAEKCVVPPEHSKKVFNTRQIVHQGSSISPGPVGLPPPTGSPWPQVISHTSHQSMPQASHLMLAGSEQSHRRGNAHLSSQLRETVAMHGPPPAHAMSQANVQRTITQTPPQGQVPAPCDQFMFQVSARYPVMWQGLLALKNDQAAVQMHFVSGNPGIARASLPPIIDGEASPVRIAQRMRLEHLQLEGVKKKIQMEEEHCVLMALPCGKDHMDVLHQSNNLKNGFINYLHTKQAAGIVNAAPPGCQQPAYVIHIFPSCEFTDTNLARIAPDLQQIICDLSHLVIVIATV